MNRALRNKQNVQLRVKEAVHQLLEKHGYVLSFEKYEGGLFIIAQWANPSVPHSFQLRWDSRDSWFDLGEFNRLENLNYLSATEVGLFPYRPFCIVRRDRYNARYQAKIEAQVKERLTSL